MAIPLLAAAWLAAFAVVGALSGPWWLVGAWCGLLLPVGAITRGRGGAILLGAAAVTALAGGWRFSEWQERPLPGLAAYTGQAVLAEGLIDSEADPGRTTARFRLRVERVAGPGGAWLPIDGKLILTLNQYADLLPGDRVRVRGTIEAPEPIGGFDYGSYLLERGITGTMLFPVIEREDSFTWSLDRSAAVARNRLERALDRSLPEPESSLAAGIAFGRDGGMSREVVDDFRESGLAHIVAVSGANVAVVAAMAFWLATRVMRRQLAIVPAALVVAAYVVTAGPSASVTRAGLMAGIYLVGLAIGHPQAGLAALGAAAIGMTAIQPGAATDVGFQLSMAATAGLFAFAPWLRSALSTIAQRTGALALIPPGLIEVFALSLAATAATTPIVWTTFGRISLVGPFVNALMAPVIAIAFPAALLTAIVGAIWAPLGWLGGLATYYPLTFIIWSAETAAAVPFASFSTPATGDQATAVVAVSLAIVGWLGYIRLAPEPPRPPPAANVVRQAGLLASGGALALVVLRTSLLPMGSPGELTVSFLDVGQGDAILITAPGGRRTLVDGGPSGIELARQVSSQLPHWSRRIDRVILTHPQEDHAGGLPEILRRYDIGEVLTNGATNQTSTLRLFAAEAPTRRTLARGDSWKDGGVRFEVLWPPPDGADGFSLNDGGLVLLVTYGETSFLLTADVEKAAQAALLAGGPLKADVLKTPHHGSKTSDPAFLRAVGSSLAVILVGESNRFGHPARETLAALGGTRVLRTDLDGRVTIHSDGRRLSVSTER